MSAHIDELRRKHVAYRKATDRVRAAYDSLIDAYTIPDANVPGILDAAERVLKVLATATSRYGEAMDELSTTTRTAKHERRE